MLLMGYPLENCLGAVFWWCFNKASYIWEIRHFENSKIMELRKVREKHISNGKEKERREGFWKNITAEKNWTQ